MSEFKVNITVKHRNKVNTVSISLDSLGLDLAEEAAKLHDVDTYRIGFLFKGKKLNQCKTLKESDVAADSTLFIIIDKKRPELAEQSAENSKKIEVEEKPKGPKRFSKSFLKSLLGENDLNLHRPPDLSVNEHIRNSVDELAYIRLLMDMYSDENADNPGHGSNELPTKRQRNVKPRTPLDVSSPPSNADRRKHSESQRVPESKDATSKESQNKGSLNADEIRDIRDMWYPRRQTKYYKPPAHLNPKSEKNPVPSPNPEDAVPSRRRPLPSIHLDEDDQLEPGTKPIKLARLKMKSSKNLDINDPLPPIVIKEKPLAWIKATLPGLLAATHPPNTTNKGNVNDKEVSRKKEDTSNDEQNPNQKPVKPAFELFNINSEKIANQIIKQHTPLDVPEPTNKLRKRKDSDKKQKKSRKGSNSKKAKKPRLIIPRRLSMPPDLEEDSTDPISSIKVTIKKKCCGTHTTKIESDGKEATFEIEDLGKLLSNPKALMKTMTKNPTTTKLLNNREFQKMISDPHAHKKLLKSQRKSEGVRHELVKKNDRLLSHIEQNMPGGFYALARMYKNSQKDDDNDNNPFEEINTRTKIIEEREAEKAAREGTSIDKESNTMTTDPMPNPWAPRLPMLLAITDGMTDDEKFMTEQLAQLAELENRVAMNNEATLQMSHIIAERSRRIAEGNNRLKQSREKLLSNSAARREAAYKTGILKNTHNHPPSPPLDPKPNGYQQPNDRRSCADSHFKKLAECAMKSELDMIQEIDPEIGFPEKPLDQFILANPQSELFKSLDNTMDISSMTRVLRNLGEIAMSKIKDFQMTNTPNSNERLADSNVDTSNTYNNTNHIVNHGASTSKCLHQELPPTDVLRDGESDKNEDIWIEDKPLEPYEIARDISTGISDTSGVIVGGDDIYKDNATAEVIKDTESPETKTEETTGDNQDKDLV